MRNSRNGKWRDPRAKRFHGVFDAGSFVGGSIENGRVYGARFERRLVGIAHWCPGCNKPHVLHKSDYEFDGIEETIRPAAVFPINLNPATGQRAQEFHCVYMITKGRIYFGRECTHRLAGREVDLPEWRTVDAQLPAVPGLTA